MRIWSSQGPKDKVGVLSGVGATAPNEGRTLGGGQLESNGSGVLRVTGAGSGKFKLPGENDAPSYSKLFHIVGLGLLPIVMGFGLSRITPRIAEEKSPPEAAAKPFPIVVEANAIAPHAPEVVKAHGMPKQQPIVEVPKKIKPEPTTEQRVREIFNQLKFKELAKAEVDKLFEELGKIQNNPKTDAKVKDIIKSEIMGLLKPEKQAGVKR